MIVGPVGQRGVVSEQNARSPCALFSRREPYILSTRPTLAAHLFGQIWIESGWARGHRSTGLHNNSRLGRHVHDSSRSHYSSLGSHCLLVCCHRRHHLNWHSGNGLPCLGCHTRWGACRYHVAPRGSVPSPDGLSLGRGIFDLD